MITGMIYPFILVGVAIAVVVALMVFVVPELVGIFAHTSRELPVLTRMLIAASDFFRDYGLWVFVGLVALVVAFRQLLRHPARRMRTSTSCC